MERKRGELWAIVLAAGEGTRMARLTQMVHGAPVPKQFATLDGDRSFVQRTIDRLSGVVPTSRTMVVVGEGHQDYAQAQLRSYKGLTVLPQPVDLGTGPGVLFALCHVLARDPEARVLILPSDQAVEDVATFAQTLRRVVRAAEATPIGVAVLGAEPDRDGVDLGWVMPDLKERGGRTGARDVRRFFDHAPEELEELLRARGGLWNTNIVAGSAAALWQLFEEHLPSQTANFRRYLSHVGFPQERRIREDVYWETLPADFAHEVIARTEGLSVVALGDVGWADCGTPERYLAAVRGTPAFHALLARLARVSSGASMATPMPLVVGAA